ncbi:iron chelate uptake ABC transporter family permease subunit, partial [Rhodococcus hoagii]|nr:iron chelate uptake ABC transporter family permease subunit [Prescottella equi]
MVQALFGDVPARIHMVVVEWRLPRVLLAILLGAALGMVARSSSRSHGTRSAAPTSSLHSGAYTGALVVILIVGGSYYQVGAGALIGGIVTAAAVYLLAYKRCVQGFRLIIVGIGISAMLASVNTWLILKADLETAMSAAVWGAGSLGALGWSQVGPVTICCWSWCPRSWCWAGGCGCSRWATTPPRHSVCEPNRPG